MNFIKQLTQSVMSGPPHTHLDAAESVWDAMGSPNFRLPSHITPRHYAIELQPNATRNTFAGAVYITLRVAEAPAAPLTHLVLHTLDITLEQAFINIYLPAKGQPPMPDPPPHPSQRRAAAAPQKLLYDDANGRYVPCVGLRRSASSETTQLLFSAALPDAVGDEFVLLVERFDGTIGNYSDMAGLYHSSSTNEAVLSTHLEPTYARRLFPCFDEPAIQATFQLSVVTGSELTVLSNTEVEADLPLSALPYPQEASFRRRMSAKMRKGGDAEERATCSPAGPSSDCREWTPASCSSAGASSMRWHCTRFQQTPLLHTCVIGFHVGQFTILEQHTRLSQVLCRVVLPHTEPNSSGWFALDLATKALDFFEEFFDVQLPLKKLDVVAVEKLAVLGMENWGLINLHMDYLVVTETTSLERRQRITRLIGHETCHQWFGNWISVEWWNCLWLKEGMCRYLEYFFVNAAFPSWGLWNEFLAVTMNDALLADADPIKTHPVDCCNSAPRRIYDSFDTISYGKGACVLRMMFSIIGTEWLQRATHLLMIRFANKSFNAKDLGDCIVETADEYSSTEVQVQHAKAIRYALQMVETVSHPYLYIQQFPNKGYHIMQCVPPSKQYGLLVEYWRSQCEKAGAPVIDLFSTPAQLSFQWKPEEMLTRVSKPFSLPLRSAQWHRGGHGSVRLIFIENVEHYVPPLAITAASQCSNAASPRSLPTQDSSVLSPEGSKSIEHDTLSSSIPALKHVCYFNHGGSGFYQCDYDMETWRQLFEHVAAFSDEERMVITLHFINTSKAQVGHQPDTTGDRCTLLFEWLLRLMNSPGAMNSFLWEIITCTLIHRVQLVQQYYCQSTVKAFVNRLYMPLQKRCVLSFFAQEKTVSFQSSLHLSRQLVLRILQLLCLCENPEVMDEAEETAQWALARVVPPPEAAGGGGSIPTAASGCATAATMQLSVEGLSSHSTAFRPNVLSPLAVAPLGASARRPSQPDVGSGGAGLPSTPACPATGPRNSPVRSVPPQCHPLVNSFTASASRALPSPHSSTDHNTGNNSNLLNSTGGQQSTTDWAGVKNSCIASYPYQRAAELNLADPSHIKMGEIALAHLASQGRMEYWVAAAAVAAEVLELDKEPLQNLSGMTVPLVRLGGLDRGSRDDYLRLVLPAVFALDREQAFPFMADVFQAMTFFSPAFIESLYRNSRFLLYLISHGHLTNRRVLYYIVSCGAETCSNGFVIAQLKALAQGMVNSSDAIASSVEMFKGVEFVGFTVPATGDRDGNSAPSIASPSQPGSQPASFSVSAASGGSTERRALRQQFPAVASALDMMESNCVWMDYCCWHYDRFFREQQPKPAWRPTRSEANSSMQMSILAGEELEDGSESVGGVSI
ncbi:puromycin-sensitive aminopeptidase-like protein metallo-peptidase Clan MA(E) Family M1 [Leptomonas seymouri]|uniref:Puromycin-sensitive aminopeptidase-like protein metallo-peptidase Clan MA(E) Family M1 n=1 Tax=Leptomonas seymouri TaxID=5684 RepID=A0A0N0P6F4_LEPSE|nr:puromycin-sensitive aminopeptidase-like protein metallo-peptidase Clan MA(E) Family M1 [Leptomonas seymouri]|eukprot:KPI87559.1 puromycin-sensitive aminopeptidase-like protein metallo-peptidase Clan MA(E) Family M1 [Leptomonas seymouri]